MVSVARSAFCALASFAGLAAAALAQSAPAEPLRLSVSLGRQGHLAPLRALALSPDGRLIATGSEDGKLTLYDLKAQALVFELALDAPATAVGFTADGNSVISATRSGAVQLWSAASQSKGPLLQQPREVTALAAGALSGLVTASLDGAARLYDLQSAQPKVFQSDAPALAVAVSGDGRFLVTGHAHSKLRAGRQTAVVLWDALSGKLLRCPAGPTSDVLAVAIDAQGKRLAAGDAEGNLHVWSLASPDDYLKLRGTAGAVRGLAFRPDGALLVSVGDDGALRVFDLAWEQQLVYADAHKGGASALAFAPGGKAIVTAGADGLVRVWDARDLSAAPERAVTKALAEGKALADAQKHAEARDHYRAAAARFASSGDAQLRLGLELFATGDPAGGKAALEKAVALQPGNVEALYYLAVVLAQSGKADEARAHLWAATVLNPNPAAIYQLRASLDSKAGRQESAARSLHDGLAVQPNHPGILYDLACVTALRKNPDAALGWLEKAIDNGFNNAAGADKDPDLKSLQGNARFVALLKRISSTSGAVATGEAGAAGRLLKQGIAAFKRGENEAALGLFRRALAEQRAAGASRLLQQEPLYWIGMSLEGQDRFDEAVRAWDEGLAAGESAFTPVTLNMLAQVLLRQRNYDRAADAYQRAATLQLAAGEWSLAAKALVGWGDSLRLGGHFDRAMEQYRAAIQLRGKADPAKISAALRGIGRIHAIFGQRAEALASYQQAVVEARADKTDLSELLAALSQLGAGVSADDKRRAADLYQEASDVARRLGRRPDVVIGLGQVAKLKAELHDAAGARLALQREMDEARSLQRKRSIGQAFADAGTVHRILGEKDAALESFRSALPFARADKDPDFIADVLGGAARTHWDAGEYEKAAPFLAEQVEILKQQKAWPEAQQVLSNLGFVYFRLKRYAEAVPYLTQSVQIVEQLRKTATGEARRDFFVKEVDVYQTLALCQMGKGDAFSAYRTIELSRAKLLAEKLALADDEVAVPTVAQLQKIAGQGSILLYSHSNWPQLGQFWITREGLSAFAHATEPWTTALLGGAPAGEKAAAIARRGVKKRQGPSQLERSDALERVVNLYRSLLLDTSEGGRAAARAAGRRLFDELIAPHLSHLHEGEDLLIVPDGVLAFLPFETFVDPQGRYLAERFRIRYVQSLAVLEQIGRRGYPAGRKPMLAFGGAPYAAAGSGGKQVETEAQLASFETSVHAQLDARGSLRKAYAALGIERWEELPGTLAEVRALPAIVRGAEVIEGAAVRESKVKSLSQSGELARYKVLHFATHGIVVPQLPELSALVLSQAPDGDEDGYLRMGEISQLKLQADFVNLSACETGLGRIYGGEGVVGLTQAFLIAGANGVSVSLWQVADESTSKFMQELYRVAERDGRGFAAASAEVKRKFIRGDFGEAGKAPYFWAPFVHYGQ